MEQSDRPATQPDVPVLAIRHLSKSFGGERALNDVSLTIRSGEIHGLLGENGSGKSTLIKVLAGYHAPDPGAELEVNGQPVKLPLHPGEFRSLGMSFVHQDLGLVPSLTVLDNLRVSEYACQSPWLPIAWGRERRKARETFARFNVDLSPDTKVESLSPVDRALLAIVRAVHELHTSQPNDGTARHLLVLDEPTVFLPKTDTDRLFDLVRNIASEGSSVLFVSHDLDEVLAITDRVTVLRDGRLQGTVVTADVTEGDLVEMIIGRRLGLLAPEHHPSTDDERVHVSIAGASGQTLRDVTIHLTRGEVLGITGLVGSGFEELPYMLAGAVPARSGQLSIEGMNIDLPRLTPRLSLAAGIALVPADRQRDGSVPDLSIADNVMLQVLERYFTAGTLRRGQMVNDAKRILTEFDVRPNVPTMPYQALSGGNQQKALLAKWLQIEPQLLLLHEPTQGVDIGARQQIFALVRAAADKGMSVICASSDYEQLAAICDRVLVVVRGRVTNHLVGSDLTKERIAEHCFAVASSGGRQRESGATT